MERRDLHGVPLDLARQVASVLAEHQEEIQAAGMQVQVELSALGSTPPFSKGGQGGFSDARSRATHGEPLPEKGGAGVAVTVRADPDGLAMVLRNLIDNALKFSRDSQPPTLAISATPTEKNVILAIQDNGIGFDMQFHERIFDIFQRLQRAEDYPGTGVGLAIVRKAIQRMGGRVWAESVPGQGATFYLELPR